MNKLIEITPYNPKWPSMFEAEVKQLKHALGRNCIEVHHIGSTSIPNLSAKPIIDILIVVDDILSVDLSNAEMEELGYKIFGEHGIAFRRFFQKKTSTKSFNVHTYEKDDPEISRYLKFRNWMRNHSVDAKKYETLKIELAQKFPNDILSYCLGKDDFVASIDAKDGFKGWRMVQALTTREWQSLKDLRLQYFSFDVPFPEDFKSKEHIHFMFYNNSDIIGYAHIHLCNSSANLLMLVIKKEHQHLEIEGTFLALCKRWTLHQGFKELNLIKKQ